MKPFSSCVVQGFSPFYLDSSKVIGSMIIHLVSMQWDFIPKTKKWLWRFDVELILHLKIVSWHESYVLKNVERYQKNSKYL
jgi:hypothetical protein